MDRRTLLSGIGTVAVAVSGCSGGESTTTTETTKTQEQSTPADNTVAEDAGTLILSVEQISAQVPGQWTLEQTRESDSRPVGLQSSQVVELVGDGDDDELEHGVVVFDTVDNAATFIDDESEDDYDNEHVADEAVSTSSFGTTLLLARQNNVIISEYGSPHISNLRTLAEEQVGALST